jgi:hypothetical protein
LFWCFVFRLPFPALPLITQQQENENMKTQNRVMPAMPDYVNAGYIFGVFACDESARRAYELADLHDVPELADFELLAGGAE